MTFPPSRTEEVQPLCRIVGHPSWWDLTIDGRDESDRQRRRRHAKARKVCGYCPLLARCADAVDPTRDHGVWAGELFPRRESTSTRASA